MQNVWGYDYVGDTKTIDVHVKRVRAKKTFEIGVLRRWGLTAGGVASRSLRRFLGSASQSDMVAFQQ